MVDRDLLDDFHELTGAWWLEQAEAQRAVAALNGAPDDWADDLTDEDWAPSGGGRR